MSILPAPEVVRQLAAKYVRPPETPVPPVDPFKDANLDEVERAYVATVMSVMTKPGFKHVRERVRNGEIALAIEFGEVTWVDADQDSEALARVATPPTTETQDSIRRLIAEASAAGTALANVASQLEKTIQTPGQSESTDSVVSLVCAEWGIKPAEIHSKRPGLCYKGSR